MFESENQFSINTRHTQNAFNCVLRSRVIHYLSKNRRVICAVFTVKKRQMMLYSDIFILSQPSSISLSKVHRNWGINS